MADKLDMLNVLRAVRPSQQTMSWRGAEAVSNEKFLRRVSVWRALTARTSGQGFALYLGDLAEFAAALFGAWQAGKTIYLPGDNLPRTCVALRRSVHGYLGDFAAPWQPQAPAQDAVGNRDVFHRFDPDFTGLVLYTSGTTGSPQAIPKKLAQLAAEVAALEAQFGALLGGADIVSTVSHQHIYGLLFNVLWPLTAGRAVHSAGSFFIERLTVALPQRDCTLVSSPAHLKRLPQDPVLGGLAKRLRAVFSSGAPLAFAEARECKRLLGQTPTEIYGSSETGGIAWRKQENSDEPWTPFPRVRWRVNPTHGVLEVSSAYLPNREWLRTADRALAESRNRFVLKGRTDRIAKVEAKRISLTAIESSLATSPWVIGAHAIVLEGRRQRVAAFIVLSDIGRERLAELGRLHFSRSLRGLLVNSVEAVALPRIWRYLDALPVNEQGKTTIAELSELLHCENHRPTEPRKRMLEKNSRAAIFELNVPRDLLYFDGHFPGLPVLPGVAQIDWVISCGRQCFDLPPLFRGIHGLKFHRVIPPETLVRLEIAYNHAKSSLSFQIMSEIGRHATGRILFGAADV